jgi:energy-coupling factor transport system permease protein
MREIAFGQYYPADSPVHRLDPRTKLVLTVAFIVAVFFVMDYSGFILLGAFLLFCIFLSRVPLRLILRSIKTILFLIIFTAVLNLLFNTDGTAIWPDSFLAVTYEGLDFAIKMVIRLMVLVTGSSLLTYTTTPVALPDGMEKLLRPLRLVRFPVHEFALTMSIALRSIPSLMEETDRIIRAQKARGADFDSRNLLRRARAMIPILIPLLIGAFRRAEDLALAMDSRCYRGSRGRTKMKVLRYGSGDGMAYLFFIAFFMLILVDKYIFFGLL